MLSLGADLNRSQALDLELTDTHSKLFGVEVPMTAEEKLEFTKAMVQSMMDAESLIALTYYMIEENMIEGNKKRHR